MSWFDKNIYFETSAVNHMAGLFSWKDAVATKERQLEKGNKYYLSPVTIWEILLTRKTDAREALIFYCQHLFHEDILPSPSELIVNYILAGCPVVEKPYELKSKIELGSVWKSLTIDKRRTFNFDSEILEMRTKLLRDASKSMSKLIIPVAKREPVRDVNLQTFAELIDHISIKEGFSSEEPKDVICRYSLLFIIYVLCLEVDIESHLFY